MPSRVDDKDNVSRIYGEVAAYTPRIRTASSAVRAVVSARIFLGVHRHFYYWLLCRGVFGNESIFGKVAKELVLAVMSERSYF